MVISNFLWHTVISNFPWHMVISDSLWHTVILDFWWHKVIQNTTPLMLLPSTQRAIIDCPGHPIFANSLCMKKPLLLRSQSKPDNRQWIFKKNDVWYYFETSFARVYGNWPKMKFSYFFENSCIGVYGDCPKIEVWYCLENSCNPASTKIDKIIYKFLVAHGHLSQRIWNDRVPQRICKWPCATRNMKWPCATGNL